MGKRTQKGVRQVHQTNVLEAPQLNRYESEINDLRPENS